MSTDFSSYSGTFNLRKGIKKLFRRHVPFNGGRGVDHPPAKKKFFDKIKKQSACPKNLVLLNHFSV